MLQLAARPDPTTTRERPRYWHLAPVITRGPEALEASRILDEVPGALGVLLWQLIRDTHLWSTTPTGDRAFLFAPGAVDRVRGFDALARPSPRLADPLATLTRVIAEPGAADPTEVAAACGAVASLASAAGHRATALEFAQVSALAAPDLATPCLEVARLAGELGEEARAETWMRRAVTIARRGEDGSAYAAALGRVYRRRRNRRAARRFFLRALRAAARAREAETRIEVRAELRDLARDTFPRRPAR
jgi:hypothetical protein